MDGTGEGAEEMIISTDLDVVAAIEGFDVPASGQDEAVRLASKAIRSLAQAEPTFVGGLVLRSIKTSGISTYVQWRRPDDGEIPLVPKAPLSLRNALQTFPILNSRNYELAFTRQGPQLSGPTKISLATTPCIHFGLFDVAAENQTMLLKRAEEEGPNSFGTPGLLAIDFHRSLDGIHVVNLGAWRSFNDIEQLHVQPSFKPGDQYFQGLAKFQPDFFDLVEVISAA